MSQNIQQNVTTRFIIDSTGYNESLRNINQELKLAQAELKNASTQMNTYGKDNERLSDIQQKLAHQTELHTKKVDFYKGKVEETSQKLRDNVKERDKLKESLNSANKNYEKAVEMYGKESEQAQKAKEAVNELEEQYKNKEKAIESNIRRVQQYETNMNRAETQLASTQRQLGDVTLELERSNNKWLQASQSLQQASEKFKNVGSNMQSVGEGILKATAPLALAGGAAFKVSADFESAMSEVKAISGATGNDLERLEEKAKEMGKATSKSATDAADGLKYMALAGWDVEKSIAGLEPILRLSEAGSMDLGRASDLVTDSMASLGVQVDELGGYLDKVAQSQSKANTSADQMLEAYVIAGGMFKTLNTDLDTSATLIGVLANRGIKGSEAGNKLSATLVNLSGSTDKTKTIFKELGIEIYNQEGKYIGIESVLEKLKVKFDGMTESQRNYYMAQLVGKTQIDTMNALLGGLGDEYYSLKEDIVNADGALMDMAETMQDNVKGDWVKLKSQLEGVGIQLGEVLIPIARDFIEQVSKWVEGFSKLDKSTQENIVKMSMFAVGLGGVLKVGGGVVSTVGNLAGGFSKLSGILGTTQVATTAVSSASAVAGGSAGLGALATGLGTAVAAAAPFMIAGGGIAAVGYGIHKKMTQEVVPSIDLFADKVENAASVVGNSANEINESYSMVTTTISDATKEAVGAYIELDNGAKKSLDSLYIDSTTMTEEIKNDMVGKYKEMGQQVINQLEKDKTESLNKLQDFFNKSSTMSEEEETNILTNTTQFYTDKQKAVTDAQEQIKSILQKAADEKRELKKEEMAEINNIQEQQRDEAVRVLSEQEVEAQIILERLKEFDGRVTAEQASEHIQTLNKQRDDAVAAAQEEYNGRIREIVMLRDEAGIISAEQAEAMIADAKRQRDETITKAEETRDGAVKTMKEMNTDLETQVDLTTGKILTFWNKLSKWWTDWCNKKEVKEFNAVMKGAVENSNPADYNYSTPVKQRWTGDNFYEGGLTTLHERGYEVYDLPTGTRIFNHDASKDLMSKMAEATSKAFGSNSGKGDIIQNFNIQSPAYMSPSEIARKAKNAQRELTL